jgi:hypothetical protein
MRFSNTTRAETTMKFANAEPRIETMTASSIIESVQQLEDSEPSAADNLNSLVQECGLPPHKISELLQELPPQRFSEVLIDHYFNAMYVSYPNACVCLTIMSSRNWTRYPLCEPDFRTAYNSICETGIGTNPNNVRFLPLLFVVLAIAVRLAPEHLAGDSRARRITSLRYYWSCEYAAAESWDFVDFL